MKKKLDRRYFFKGCLSAASLVISNPVLLAQSKSNVKFYSRVLLTDQNDEPVTSEKLKNKSCYIFNYPFVSTPCFLINLGETVHDDQKLKTEQGQAYQWTGGVGPGNSVVAFAAICAHKLSYPTKSISFINYRAEQIIADEENQPGQNNQQVIFCCSERSMYDPLKGAKVMSGPAPQPLTTIVLDYDEQDDHYYAQGTLGGELYEQFFERFEFNLALENELIDITTQVSNTSRIQNSDEYSKHLKSC